MSVKISTCGLKRLEVAMRDVIDGLEDAACYMNYHSTPDVVEILSIEPPNPPKRPAYSKKNIISLNRPLSEDRSYDIVNYLIQRELKKSA